MDINQINRKELEALLALLDDSDSEVYEHVFDKLSTYGKEIIPELESAWADAFNEKMHERLEELIHRIQFNSLHTAFEAYVQKDEFDLLEGASILANFSYPDLELESIQNEITKLKRDIWLEMNESLTPLEKINVLNQMFFSNFNFEITSPANIDESDFYINKFLETRNAHPILVGLLYIILARKLDLPVYGLNLPNHFALVFCRNNIDFRESIEEHRSEVIFYINTHQKGAIFTKSEIEEYLSKIEQTNKIEYFVPCTDKRIIKLLLKNLLNYYISKNDEIRARELSTLVSLIL
jgi:regulator of sirC expression with transglutaminase-like and TPR domain